MAISLPGDILLDVARAADPEKVAQARARLQSFARATGFAAPQPAAGLRQADPVRADRPEPSVQFEAMVLQNFLQSMLPEEGDAVFGEGLSGQMWRSLLAQELGTALAKRGGIGIAERILGDHYLIDGKKIPVAGHSSGPEAQEAATQAALSRALVEEIERLATGPLKDGGQPSEKTK
ncbi:rod-binding protein [Chelativorans sp. Marseille-P2723]|uniref:rod-binding protein n=1 Tax=Chelativorans sp. Marseille-P2723 TaxID=2709133 RepID=UPI0015701629|nr:rod-binding protein [Chelativorans sp. Marseille-P2723]